MTNISKKALDPSQLAQLFKQYDLIVSKLTVHASTQFFEELLGHEERIMLAKRLAAIALCIEGGSIYRIATSLHLSPSTAERIYKAYKNGSFSNIERILTRNAHNFDEFLRTLEVILRGGLPPRTGRNRAHLWFKKNPKTKRKLPYG
jgi:hypothetical protein